MSRKKYDIKRIVWLTVFGLYCLFVFGILYVGRGVWQSQYDSFELYIKDCFNIIPFASVAEYVGHILDGGYFMRKWAIRNVFGNLFLFYPMGIFLPCLFPCMRTARKNARTAFRVILAVETVQLLLRIGCFDIDDLILNMAGWMLGCLTFSSPFVRRILVKFCFLRENEMLT